MMSILPKKLEIGEEMAAALALAVSVTLVSWLLVRGEEDELKVGLMIHVYFTQIAPRP